MRVSLSPGSPYRSGLRGGKRRPCIARRRKIMQSMRVMSRNAVARMLIAACLAVAPIRSAGAQDYPSRPITLVVPYPPGGGNDLIARVVAAQMSPALGQPIVVENRGGAGGTIATRQVAHA